MAEVLQWRTTPRRTGEPRPGNLRPEDRGDCLMSRETNTEVGTKMGASPNPCWTNIAGGTRPGGRSLIGLSFVVRFERSTRQAA